MFAAATIWLEKSASDIDALNVFPVPDGDTGTNMLLTMRSTMDEAYRSSDESASSVAQAMARGALMGARGNSGVILSQILRGLARGLEHRESFTGSDLAAALAEATSLAYKGISRPVEGTMLTVIREASAAAQAAAACDGNSPVSIVEAAVSAARDSVARTPSLLPVLREAGVVDAGGQGLYVMLEGALLCLKDEMDKVEHQQPQIISAGIPAGMGGIELAQPGERGYGYCTEFLLEGRRLDPDRIIKKLEGKGESVMVVGDENTVRVHIHTFDPGAIIKYATSKGTLHEIKVQNIDDQHEDFMEMRRSLAPAVKVAVVAVASGEGLTQLFTSLGATAVVPGGQSMNPSTQELLQAIEWVPADQVVLLPNNSNILLAARQARSLSAKRVEIVPTETIPQGVAALLASNQEEELETTLAAMEKARAAVKTGEITRAVRSAQIGGLKIRKGQALGLVEGEPVASGNSIRGVVDNVLSQMGVEEAEVVTIYYGADANPVEAQDIATRIRRRYPQTEVEVIHGGQPHYHYILSAE